MAKIAILADVLAPAGENNKRQISDYVQYRGTDYLQVALGHVPHAALLGPVLLGTILRGEGHEVRILECAFRAQQKRNLRALLTSGPAYVLITTTFIESRDSVAAAVDLVRRLCPHAKVILGGPSLLADLEMRRLGDFAVIGEGERALPELVRRLEAGADPAGIPGVCHFPGGKMELVSPQLLPSLDELPFPDWSLLRRRPDEYFALATQRGCYWRCAFCSYPANEGYKLRYFSVPRLIAEMKRNHELHGIRRYVFADSTFTHPHDRCVEFLEEVARLPFKVEWVAYGRVDTITAPLASAMKRSGCQGVFFGCDSGDEEILRKMNKRFTVAEIRRGVELVQAAGVPATASWIVGFPGETPASVRNTLNLILELNCAQNVVHTFTVYEQAPVGLRREKFGVEGETMHWEHGTMRSAEAVRWTRWVVLHMLARGLRLGTAHDVSWLSTVGLSGEETRDFFAHAQSLSALKFRLKPARFSGVAAPGPGVEEGFLLRCENLREAGLKHPVFARLTDTDPGSIITDRGTL